MPLPRIVVAPNAFKETFSPAQAARLIARGLRRSIRARIDLCPIADGGDGTIEALRAFLGGRLVTLPVTGPLGTPIRASYLRAGNRAVIEMARASGLRLVPPSRRNPLVTTTRGTGELIAHALLHGARKILLGVGGSATVDGGRGALEVVTPSMARRITVLCDVDNPLLGPRGAARVFGPQKGATPEKVRLLEHRLLDWSAELRRRTGVDVRKLPGGGAAGGLSAGLAAWGARLVPGAEFILRTVGFPRPCDFVITGEGCVDRTSLGGKAVGTVLRLAPAPVAIVCGRCELPRLAAFETGDRSAAALVGAAQRAGLWIKARLAPRR
ncbi:MAG TPA: glycerate kinase [Planctomycetota bacterium]|jgi:glycerate kinase|nr:glycerate kinase [Planctomycetota bacterium]